MKADTSDDAQWWTSSEVAEGREEDLQTQVSVG